MSTVCHGFTPIVDCELIIQLLKPGSLYGCPQDVKSCVRKGAVLSRALLKSLTQVSGLTLLSRVLGFLRDIGFAQVFGPTGGLDAFLVAFKIPNFMRRIFAEGAFTQAFVPVLVDQQLQGHPQRLKQFRAHVLGTLLLSVSVFAICVWIGSHPVITLFAPGFVDDPVRFELSAHMLRLTIVYLPCITVVSYAAAVMNTQKSFVLPASLPSVLNLCFLSALILPLADGFSRLALLPCAVVVAGGLQAAMVLIALYRLRCLDWPRLGWSDPGLRRVFALLAASLFGVSVTQIGLMLNTILASFLAVGSVSWLYFADRLVQLPLGVVGASLSTILLPDLSKAVASGDQQIFSDRLNWGINQAALMMIPAAAGLYVLAHPIVMSLFQYGAFSVHDAMMAMQAAKAYAIGLPAFIAVKLFASAFYAHQMVKIPVYTGLISVVLNVMLGWALMHVWGHVGLALATSAASWLDAMLLLGALAWRQIWRIRRKTLWYLLRVILASVVMMGVLNIAQSALSDWAVMGVFVRCQQLLGLLVAGGAVYAISVWVLGRCRED